MTFYSAQAFKKGLVIHFLQQPPKLPLPDVEQTLQRYLDAVETFTPPDQLAATKINVQSLLEDKQKTQAIMELLQQKFEKEESWVNLWENGILVQNK